MSTWSPPPVSTCSERQTAETKQLSKQCSLHPRQHTPLSSVAQALQTFLTSPVFSTPVSSHSHSLLRTSAVLSLRTLGLLKLILFRVPCPTTSAGVLFHLESRQAACTHTRSQAAVRSSRCWAPFRLCLYGIPFPISYSIIAALVFDGYASIHGCFGGYES